MNQLLLILIAVICFWFLYKIFFSSAENKDIILDYDASLEEEESYDKIQRITREREKLARKIKHLQGDIINFLQEKIKVLNQTLEAEKQHFEALRNKRRKANK